MIQVKKIFQRIPKSLKIGFVVLLVIVGVMWGVIVVTTKPIIHSSQELSQRAKEYLEKEKQSGSVSWDEVNFVDKRVDDTEVSGQVDLKGCFSLDVPFYLSEKRPGEGECFYQLFTSNPKGQIVLYKKGVTASLDELPDVLIRRQKPDLYDEETVVVGQRTFLTFKHTADNYEKVAMHLDKGKLYVISLLVNTNENLDAKFNSMLASLKIYE